MGFRLWRRVSIIPGVRLNLSKSGVSVSVGKRGANLTLGKKGPRVTVGLPGTGLSYTETFKGEQDKKEKNVSISRSRRKHASTRSSTATTVAGNKSQTNIPRYNASFTPTVKEASASQSHGNEEEEKPGGCAILFAVVIIIVSYLWWTGWFD